MLARGTERRDLLETVQGYVILKAATFETGHGFALGHNPGAPSPFVTWQFTEGENGHRDYYWGRYGTSQAWAQRDFDRRVDDYQQFYHAAVKHMFLRYICAILTHETYLLRKSHMVNLICKKYVRTTTTSAGHFV